MEACSTSMFRVHIYSAVHQIAKPTLVNHACLATPTQKVKSSDLNWLDQLKNTIPWARTGDVISGHTHSTVKVVSAPLVSVLTSGVHTSWYTCTAHGYSDVLCDVQPLLNFTSGLISSHMHDTSRGESLVKLQCSFCEYSVQPAK